MTTWTVPARIVRVIDGDTIVADLDQGWSTWRMAQRVRLLGCDCPEMPTPAGKAAKAYTERVLVDGNGDWRPLLIVSQALDNFGRVLGRVTFMNDDGARADLSALLLAAGHAVPR